MTAIAQCKQCSVIYKFAIVDDNIPNCPNCGGKGKTDDEGFLINGLNPDDMFAVGESNAETKCAK